LNTLEHNLVVECTAILSMLTLHSIFNDELAWHPPLMFLSLVGYAELIRRKLKAQESISSAHVVSRPEMAATFFRSPA